MTDQVMDLVESSRNFGFLAEPAIQLAGDAAAAESYMYSDPDAAMGKARRFCETLVKLVMHHSGLPFDFRKPHAHRINVLVERGVISRDIGDILHDIRKAGNAAVHDYSGDQEKAAAVVRKCFQLGLWWYRKETGRELALSYTPPQAATVRTQDFLKSLERQLAQLQSTLDARLTRGGSYVERDASVITIGPGVPDRDRWRAGSEIRCATTSYLVHDPVERITADDDSWTLLEADGHGLDAHAVPVRLRGLRTERAGASAARMVEGLAAQAAHLRRGRSSSLPGLLAHETDGKLVVTVTTRPASLTWEETFGSGLALDPGVIPLAVDAIAAVAETLVGLHRQRVAHRALSGQSILLTRTGRRAPVLRDLGLAWWPPLRGEGGVYRAPEQQSTARGRPGPATDIFQLAALLQHTCVGIRLPAGQPVRLASLIPGIPAQLDTLLARALDPDPARRPGADTFAAELRQGRRLLVTEAVHGH